MAHCERPRRTVAQNDPNLNQAVIPYMPPSPPVPDNGRQLMTAQNISCKPNGSRSTRVLSILQRPHDQIILTEDHKGKQMVVQRAHNVAKIQRRQRDEHFKPADLRLRGKQRPVAVGVVGSVDTCDKEEAMWRARQLMQNVQTQRSDQHRPLQEQEEQRIAEEARLRALAKNERKMRSYRVDMGNMLENNDNASQTGLCERADTAAARDLDNASSNMQVSTQPQSLDQMNRYEILDQYLDDEVYDQKADNVPDDLTGTGNTSTGHNGINAEASPGQATKYRTEERNEYDSDLTSDESDGDGGDSNNDFLGDEQCLLAYREDEDMGHANATPSSAAARKTEAEQRNRLRMLQIRQRQQSSMEQVIENTAHSRKLEAERKAEQARLKALKENEKKMKSYKMNVGYTLGMNVQHASSPSTTCVQRANSTPRSSITKSTTSVQRASSSPRSSIAKSTTRVSGSSAEDKMSKEEREKRRQEENRQKMLAARARQQQEHARMLEETAEARRLEEEKKAEEARLKALEKNAKKMKSYKVTLGFSLEDYVRDTAPCTDNTTGEHVHPQYSVASASSTDNSVHPPCGVSSESGESGQGMCNTRQVIEEAQSAEIVNGASVEQAVLKEQKLEVDEEEEEEEELTEEQRNQLFREQMRAARLKKQAELDKLVASNNNEKRT